VIGHGVERDGKIFCCRHCSEATEAMPMRERVGAQTSGRV
jgi:hypothetical protein